MTQKLIEGLEQVSLELSVTLNLIKDGKTLYSTGSERNLGWFILNNMTDDEKRLALDAWRWDSKQFDNIRYICLLNYCSMLQEYSVLKE